MKVVHINTSDRNGGAAIAAYRLHNAMLEDGIDSTYFVLNKSISGRKDIVTVSPVDKYVKHPLNALLEKTACLFMRNAEFSFSVFDCGIDISKYAAVKDARQPRPQRDRHLPRRTRQRIRLGKII
jgi:hypothetical protein